VKKIVLQVKKIVLQVKKIVLQVKKIVLSGEENCATVKKRGNTLYISGLRKMGEEICALR